MDVLLGDYSIYLSLHNILQYFQCLALLQCFTQSYGSRGSHMTPVDAAVGNVYTEYKHIRHGHFKLQNHCLQHTLMSSHSPYPMNSYH